MLVPGQKNTIEKLQKDILSLQGFQPLSQGQHVDFGLGPIQEAFPNRSFPGGIHEFISTSPQDAAATTGFMAGLLSRLMNTDTRLCLWISSTRTVFPPALAVFGIKPHRVIFIDLARQKDALWAMEEAMKCEVLACVVAEISEISFTESRRLQLIVEKSRVTGLLHRHNPRSIHALACVCRWKITPLASQLEEGMPGVGLPRWQVALQKVRSGQPGSWPMGWSEGRFDPITEPAAQISIGSDLLKTG